MSALSPVLRRLEDGKLAFWCPGCRRAHAIGVGAGPGPRWSWDGDAEAPTFAPSIRVRWEGPGWKKCCHSFVRGGRIQFLNDCTHALAGQTVPLPEWPKGGEG